MKKILLGAAIGSLITALLFIYLSQNNTTPETITIDEPVIQSSVSGSITFSPKPTISPSGSINPTPYLPSDFKASVPVKGSIKTEHADIEVSGITYVNLLGNNLSVDTKFTEAKVTLTLEKEKEKPFTFYTGFKMNQDGLFPMVGVSYDYYMIHNILCVSLSGEYDTQNKLEIKALAEYKFSLL
jgi:hypothetical protein